MLLENLDTATDIRIQNDKDVKSALVSLGAESPNNGRFVPGGVHSRVFLEVRFIYQNCYVVASCYF